MTSAVLELPSGSTARHDEGPSRLRRALELLADASRHLGDDQRNALDHIRQAHNLLYGALLAPPVTGGLAPWQAKRVSAYIEEHLDARIRSLDLARVARLSDRYFSEAFRVSFGERPQAYVTRRRLERAKTMMVESGESLCQIALACGLSDQSHLSRLFRIHLGRSPNHWRREQTWLRRFGEDAMGDPDVRS